VSKKNVNIDSLKIPTCDRCGCRRRSREEARRAPLCERCVRETAEELNAVLRNGKN
jgi:hypothetical protein